MMAKIYRVCPKRAAPHKGYRDVVQQTDPMISGQLRVNNINAQNLYTSFEVAQPNPLNLSKTCAAGIRETKLGDLPSLEAPTKAANRSTPGAQKEKDNAANVALWDDCFFSHQENQHLAATQDNKVTLGNPVTYETFVGQPSGDSLAFFRCRRLISPIAALTKKAAVLSLSSFTDSISCSTSCGTLTFTCFDLLFIEPVAISGLLGNRCDSVYAKKRAVQCLTCYSPSHKVNSTLIMSGYQNGNAPECGNTAGASNHIVKWSNNMACSHDTQTRPKFVYLFLGTPNEFPDSTPTVLRAEADTEDDARAKFPRWTLTFAAQIRTAAPCRLQIFSTDDGFMWVYEQRQAAPEVAHA